MDKNRLVVIINSRQYTVMSHESEEYMKKIAEHVNEKVVYVLKNTSNIMGERPIVLAALNICDEYFKSVEGANVLEEHIKRLEEKNKDLEEAIKKSVNDIDDSVQKQIIEYSKEITKLENKNKENQNIINELKQEHKREIDKINENHAKEIEKLKKEFKTKEQEFLKMIDEG